MPLTRLTRLVIRAMATSTDGSQIPHNEDLAAEVLTVDDGSLRVWVQGELVFEVPLESVESVELRGGASSVARVRELHPNAYRPWRPEEDEALRTAYTEATDITAMVDSFGRQESAIRNRLARLGLLPPNYAATPASDGDARHAKAGLPWLADEDGQLEAQYRDGQSIDTLAAAFERSPGAIRSRLVRLGLLDE